MVKTVFKWIWVIILGSILSFLIKNWLGKEVGIGYIVPILIANLIILSTYYQIGLYRKKKIKEAVELRKLQSSNELLKEINNSLYPEAFVFFLRPFGNDGAGNRFSDFDRFINIRVDENSVEGSICKKIKAEFGVRVIALADQSLSKAPEYPNYYLCNNDQWKLHAELLLKNCLFTIIYLPFGTSLRRSVKWEIFTAMCSGLRSRILVLYPDHWVNSENSIVNELKFQLSFIDGISDLSKRSIGFIMKQGCIWKQYILEDPKKGIASILPRDYKNASANIGFFLKDMFLIMRSNIDGIPKRNLNAFRNKEILDYDFDLTELQMKLIYESKEHLFEALKL
jgi:hypothetical protein